MTKRTLAEPLTNRLETLAAENATLKAPLKQIRRDWRDQRAA